MGLVSDSCTRYRTVWPPLVGLVISRLWIQLLAIPIGIDYIFTQASCSDIHAFENVSKQYILVLANCCWELDSLHWMAVPV